MPSKGPMSAKERARRRAEEIRERLGCPFLNEIEAAAYLRCSPRTLSDHRVDGTGPLYRRHFDNVAYLIDDLDAWSESRRRRSTSDKEQQSA